MIRYWWRPPDNMPLPRLKLLEVESISKNDPYLRSLMDDHYSQPKGFVGRQLLYKIGYAGTDYGCIGFGSATRFLQGRPANDNLNNGLNNIFYHMVRPVDGYPTRNFTTFCLLFCERLASFDYYFKYGDEVRWLETLVEHPRTGDLYIKAGYRYVGDTRGYTCKRVSGKSSDSWSGKRVWDTENLRPKKVFYKPVNYLRVSASEPMSEAA